MAKQITTMKRRAKDFVDEIHVPGGHTGIINSFDSSVHIGSAETSPSALKSQIGRLSASGQTALYDSIYHSIGSLATAHYKANRQGIPMAVLTFTDGKENRSNKSVDDVRRLIRESNFFPKNNCYFIIAGVGNASEREMKELCRGGYGLYIDADSIHEVFASFKSILLSKLTERKSVAVQKKRNGKVVRARQTTVKPKAAIKNLDYALNLDCSGSMR